MAGAQTRWIAHMDLDAFFASCEQRAHPEYRGKPVVVGARPGHRGVVAAASYEARRFGVRSAMPIAEAVRRCPDAIFVRPDMDYYRQMSQQVFAVLETVTPLVEKASVDEAYLDISGLGKLVGPPHTIGALIKSRIHETTGLTASVGIGPNRLIAKLGSEHRKPNGLVVVEPGEVLDFLTDMPVSNLRGLGRKTADKLQNLGIKTVGNLRGYPLATLEQHLGSRAAAGFLRQANGIASDVVVPQRRRKQISKETTFSEDVADSSVLHDTLRRLAASVARTARREGLRGTVVTLKIRLEGFETHTRQRKQAIATNDERAILKTAWRLYQHGSLPGKPVRLIGVGLSDWQQLHAQSDLFEAENVPGDDERLLQTVDAVNEKFGDGLLHLGLDRRNRSAQK